MKLQPFGSHKLISIDSTFGVGDNVTEVTSPTKFGSDPMSGRDATSWGQHTRPRTAMGRVGGYTAPPPVWKGGGCRPPKSTTGPLRPQHNFY